METMMGNLMEDKDGKYDCLFVQRIALIEACKHCFKREQKLLGLNAAPGIHQQFKKANKPCRFPVMGIKMWPGLCSRQLP